MGHLQSAGRSDVHVPDVLAALFDETDCDAVFFLHEQGVRRLDVVMILAHGPNWQQADASGSQADPSDPLDGEDEESDEGEPTPRPATDPLKAYTSELTQAAREGRIDPLVGRVAEIDRLVHVLQRRRKNNPVLVGDPGVGKTALVEGLAWKVARGEVPQPLREVRVFRLDLGALLAGTRYRGDFESRVKAVLAALEAVPEAVLFIDEIHTVIGAGAATGGTMDASNLLKPALESGRLRCIGATTWEEFRQYFERDRALARRFQKVEVIEPSREQTVEILRGLASRYEEHHKVRYAQTALEAAADLAARYLRDRRLPDKAIDLMDEAGAAVALAGRRQVTAPDVEDVLASMAQIPPQRVKSSEKDRLKDLEPKLKAVVFGQDEAVSRLVSAIKVSRAGLREPNKPVGSFLMTGPTGVGKTELARQLAEVLGVSFLRFDMSEYMERHSVSRLVGAPPGYVGFDQSGMLTEAVSQNPHAVVLLDEIEKAHPDVFNMLLSIMDYGTLTDSHGRKTDFRQAILLMTSNLGARDAERGGLGFGGQEASAGSASAAAYERLFAPEFRNRLDARLEFGPLTPEVMGLIVDKFIDELRAQLAVRGVRVAMTDQARGRLAEMGFDRAFGARPLGRVIEEHIKLPLTDEVLFGRLEGGGKVTVDEEAGRIVLRFG
jgi:ATP-dependent Clp protease ATP-binding subunit ClpA